MGWETAVTSSFMANFLQQSKGNIPPIPCSFRKNFHQISNKIIFLGLKFCPISLQLFSLGVIFFTSFLLGLEQYSLVFMGTQSPQHLFR
jgi:hypothetical protein